MKNFSNRYVQLLLPQRFSQQIRGGISHGPTSLRKVSIYKSGLSSARTRAGGARGANTPLVESHADRDVKSISPLDPLKFFQPQTDLCVGGRLYGCDFSLTINWFSQRRFYSTIGLRTHIATLSIPSGPSIARRHFSQISWKFYFEYI